VSNHFYHFFLRLEFSVALASFGKRYAAVGIAFTCSIFFYLLEQSWTVVKRQRG